LTQVQTFADFPASACGKPFDHVSNTVKSMIGNLLVSGVRVSDLSVVQQESLRVVVGRGPAPLH
jgi:hypothetical protein